jgi:hypothetical protein
LINQKPNSVKVVLLIKTIAKRIGYTVTTGVTQGLRKKNEIRDIKYWTYHHDEDHFAIVLISNTTLTELGF